jgi:hypothetical protein
MASPQNETVEGIRGDTVKDETNGRSSSTFFESLELMEMQAATPMIPLIKIPAICLLMSSV